MVFAVAGPTLPNEILAEIASLAAPKPEFDFLQTDWAQGVEYTTLKALCLTSRVFNHLATPHLYSHLVVPSAQIAQSLIDTLESDKWQTGERASKVNEWVKCITIGSRVKRGPEVDGALVKEVLSVFVGGRVSRLSIAGVKLTSTDTFTTLDHLEFLQLVQVSHDFPVNDPPATLDKVTHLHASNVRHVGLRHEKLLERVKLPSLTHFTLRNKSTFSSGYYRLGLGYVASTIEFLTLQESTEPGTREVASYGKHFTRLRRLALLPPASHAVGHDFNLETLLERLPQPLAVLDLAALSSEHSPWYYRVLRDTLRQGCPCVSSSTLLRLPGPDQRGLRRRGQLSRHAIELEEAADLAEERGLRVEWV